MLNLLNASVGEYLKENVVLTVVLALILALIAVLSGIMIYLQVKAKKNGGSEAPTQENASEEPEAEQPAEEEKQEPVKEEAPAEEAKEEPAKESAEEPKVEEPAPTVQEEAEPTKEEKAEEPAKESENSKTTVAKITTKRPAAKKTEKTEEKKEEEKPVGFQDGKWVIRKTADGKFSFKLYASNGGVMLESSKEYASLSTAKKGIETYKKNFEENNCKIVSPKAAHYVYRLSNANGMLLAVSNNYTSKSSCESALEATKRYALGAPIEVITD